MKGATGKLLIISGGSRGIGLSTVERFQSEGYAVLNISRSPCPLPAVHNLALDLSAADWPERSGKSLTDACRALLPAGKGEVVLVHNAASLRKDAMQTVSAAALASVLQLNVIAPTQLNQQVLPFMAAGSSVIYVGSTLSEKAVAGCCSYVTSKHALVGLMRASCQDLAGTGIHTACVCPGFTDTEMLRDHLGNDAAIMASIAEGVTFKRLIKPEEIADVIYSAASYPVFNGAVLHANLGQIER